jgi:hypothetical protein
VSKAAEAKGVSKVSFLSTLLLNAAHYTTHGIDKCMLIMPIIN